ncbi:MAG: CoA-binding protein, partial [Rhodospirillaceae bacterium]
MSIRNLEALYAPSSVAVIGASSDPSTVGGMVMRNLMEGGFNGPVMPVTKSVRSVAGVLAYPSVADLPLAPDLAVICSATTELPGLVSELGTKGTKACLVMAFDLEEQKGPDGQDLLTLALEAARPSMLRLLGPGSIGFMVPGIGLNASYFQSKSGPGKVAFISRSTAMCTTVLDWAQSRDIGFTHFISLGDKGDVDFGDTIDYLSVQPEVRSILLHIDNLNDARKFLSAARSAARNKPVIAIKAGRSEAGSDSPLLER